MKSWSALILLLAISACQNESKPKAPETLKRDEMPAQIRQLFTGVDQHPDSVGLRFKLVDALDSLGAYSQAIAQMDSLIKKDSLNYGFWYRLANLQENIHDTTGALRSYRYAIRIYPSPDAMLGAANLLAERKDSISLRICREVLGFRMGREYTAHCNFITGIYYARTGNTAKAIQSFNTCIENDLNYMEAYMEKGFLAYDAHQLPEAQKIFETVVTVKNTYADGYYWLAKCNEKAGNTAAAIQNYQKSLALDPGISEATEALKRLGAK